MEISCNIFLYVFLPIVVWSQISLVFYLWTALLKFVERSSTEATKEEEQKLDMAKHIQEGLGYNSFHTCNDQ